MGLVVIHDPVGRGIGIVDYADGHRVGTVRVPNGGGNQDGCNPDRRSNHTAHGAEPGPAYLANSPLDGSSQIVGGGWTAFRAAAKVKRTRRNDIRAGSGEDDRRDRLTDDQR